MGNRWRCPACKARKQEHPLFSKIVADNRHVTHVALLHDAAQVGQLETFLREAYEYSRR